MAIGVAVLAGVGPVSSQASKSPPFFGETTVGTTGMSVLAYGGSSGLRSIKINFTSGVEIGLEPAAHELVYATYSGAIGSDRGYFGKLMIPANKASGTFTLRYRPQPNGESLRIKATLGTGSKPSLTLSGFPAGTTKFELATRGAGTSATRATKCDGELAKYRGRMRLTLRSGATKRGQASGEFSCRKLPSAS